MGKSANISHTILIIVQINADCIKLKNISTFLQLYAKNKPSHPQRQDD